MSELFDIVNTIFDKDDRKWDKLSNNKKSRNFFMVNRIMAIQFPIQANEFNKLNVVPYPVLDWWHRTLSKRYTKKPNWVYTKTNKAETKNASNQDDKDYEEVENFIREKYQVSKRELAELKYFFPDRYSKWISDLKEQIGTSSK